MFVRDAMYAHAEWITPDVTLQEAAQKMRDAAIGCLPVGENDRLIGMLTEHDLVWRGCANGADPRTTKVRGIMTSGIVYCLEDETIDTVLQRMAERKIHHMPVLNSAKRMVGMLSFSDLAAHASDDILPRLRQIAARDADLHAERRPVTADIGYDDPYA